MSQYLDEKTLEDIKNYLAGIDESQTYADFQQEQGIQNFLVEITKNIQIPLRKEVDGKYVGVEVYSLLDIISGNTDFDLTTGTGDYYDKFQDASLQIANANDMKTYVDSVANYLELLINPQTDINNVTVSLIPETGSQDPVQAASQQIKTDMKDIFDLVNSWTQGTVELENGETKVFTEDNRKIGGLFPGIQLTRDEKTGEVVRGSSEFYTGYNITIDDKNQYVRYEVDPTTGDPKLQLVRDENGNPIKPWFTRGSAAEAFIGMSPTEIFNMQQQLAAAGLDLSSYNFVPGEIDFSTTENEIGFLADLMTQANDMQWLAPNSTRQYIDKEAPTILGQLAPFLKLKEDDMLLSGTALDPKFQKSLEQYGKEVLPPSDVEVKQAIDGLFASKGLTATAADYKKYGEILADLQSQAAAREIQIKQNQMSLNDIIGLSTGEYTRTPGQGFRDIKFNVKLPTPEEARSKLGKPLLTPINVAQELNNQFEKLEAGKISAVSEMAGRRALANSFRDNFLAFEESW
tara:strand:- start:4569 stop:6122 length:1554 start_codon:yes stop_codon:yes gene_type:complete